MDGPLHTYQNLLSTGYGEHMARIHTMIVFGTDPTSSQENIQIQVKNKSVRCLNEPYWNDIQFEAFPILEAFQTEYVVKEILKMYIQTQEIRSSDRGARREKLLCDVLRRHYGDYISLSGPSAPEDIIMWHYKLQIKHISRKRPSPNGIKLKWGGGEQNCLSYIANSSEFKHDFLIVFVEEPFCTVLHWNAMGMNQVKNQMGQEFFKKLNGTNTRGVELTRDAFEFILSQATTWRIDIEFTTHKTE